MALLDVGGPSIPSPVVQRLQPLPMTHQQPHGRWEHEGGTARFVGNAMFRVGVDSHVEDGEGAAGEDIVEPDQQPLASKGDIGSSAISRVAQLTRSPEMDPEDAPIRAATKLIRVRHCRRGTARWATSQRGP
jgi:hypothetical protein